MNEMITTEELQQTSPFGLVQHNSDTVQFIARVRELAGMPEPIHLKEVFEVVKDKFRYYRNKKKKRKNNVARSDDKK
jgi:hypothetical protein